MASMAGCTHLLVVGTSSPPAATTIAATTIAATTSRTSTASGVSAPRGVWHRRTTTNDKRTVSRVAFSSGSAALCGEQLSFRSSSGRGSSKKPCGTVDVRGYQSSSDVVGEDPDWSEADFIAVGLAHCFRKDDEQKLIDAFVIEPIPAGGLECMENGGVTCYKHATGTTLGVALKQDASLLPKEFSGAAFSDGFDFRAKCASRTWKRDHPRQNLMNLVPRDGTVRSDWNFSLQDKRVLNQEHIVKDSDNIKQDLSIDVYGRTEKEEEMTAEIGQLYNV